MLLNFMNKRVVIVLICIAILLSVISVSAIVSNRISDVSLNDSFGEVNYAGEVGLTIAPQATEDG